jgi:hypothetical protein
LQIRKAISVVSDEFNLEFRNSKCVVTFQQPYGRDVPEERDVGSRHHARFPVKDKRFPRFSSVNTSVYLALKKFRLDDGLTIRVVDEDQRRNGVPQKRAGIKREMEDQQANGLSPKRFRMEDEVRLLFMSWHHVI